MRTSFLLGVLFLGTAGASLANPALNFTIRLELPINEGADQKEVLFKIVEHEVTTWFFRFRPPKLKKTFFSWSGDAPASYKELNIILTESTNPDFPKVFNEGLSYLHVPKWMGHARDLHLVLYLDLLHRENSTKFAVDFAYALAISFFGRIQSLLIENPPDAAISGSGGWQKSQDRIGRSHAREFLLMVREKATHSVLPDLQAAIDEKLAELDQKECPEALYPEPLPLNAFNLLQHMGYWNPTAYTPPDRH
jgi:hypothetical protein